MLVGIRAAACSGIWSAVASKSCGCLTSSVGSHSRCGSSGGQRRVVNAQLGLDVESPAINFASMLLTRIEWAIVSASRCRSGLRCCACVRAPARTGRHQPSPAEHREPGARRPLSVPANVVHVDEPHPTLAAQHEARVDRGCHPALQHERRPCNGGWPGLRCVPARSRSGVYRSGCGRHRGLVPEPPPSRWNRASPTSVSFATTSRVRRSPTTPSISFCAPK